MKRSRLSGIYTVTGPYEEPHPVPSVGAGISVAQSFASKHRKLGDATWYVRKIDNTLLALVTLQDGVIHTTAHSAFTKYAA